VPEKAAAASLLFSAENLRTQKIGRGTVSSADFLISWDERKGSPKGSAFGYAHPQEYELSPKPLSYIGETGEKLNDESEFDGVLFVF
jgi:hypothetical protein